MLPWVQQQQCKITQLSWGLEIVLSGPCWELLLHWIMLRVSQENLLDLGRLLMHGAFSVWTEHKRELFKDLRFKPMQRNIFLYERGLLLCKKKEESNDDPVYTFKNKLKVSEDLVVVAFSLALSLSLSVCLSVSISLFIQCTVELVF